MSNTAVLEDATQSDLQRGRAQDVLDYLNDLIFDDAIYLEDLLDILATCGFRLEADPEGFSTIALHNKYRENIANHAA